MNLAISIAEGIILAVFALPLIIFAGMVFVGVLISLSGGTETQKPMVELSFEERMARLQTGVQAVTRD